MLYCFSRPQLQAAFPYDDMALQARFAHALGAEAVFDPRTGAFTRLGGGKVTLTGERVLLRCGHEDFASMASAAEEQGARLVESERERAAIRRWYALLPPRRPLFRLTADEILSGHLPRETAAWLTGETDVFFKSVRKGGHQILSARRLLFPDRVLKASLEGFARQGYGEYLVARRETVAEDAWGRREVRCFVWAGRPGALSRCLLGRPAEVPEAFPKAAEEFTARGGAAAGFPRNYVLDLAEWVGPEGPYVDVVELNPVSTALCYSGNSVFPPGSLTALGLESVPGLGDEFRYSCIREPSGPFSALLDGPPRAPLDGAWQLG